MRRSVRPFARSFETRDHGGAPTQEPPEFLLGLCPCIADVPEGLGVAHRGLARALTEAGSLTSHSCPLVQRVRRPILKPSNLRGLNPPPLTCLWWLRFPPMGLFAVVQRLERLLPAPPGAGQQLCRPHRDRHLALPRVLKTQGE